MKISRQAVAELAALTASLGDPDIDLLRSLTRFVDKVRLAVPSYLGVTLAMTTPDSRTTIDVMEEVPGPGTVRSSLIIPASRALGQLRTRAAGQPAIGLILYAAAPGALVDLAADLGWLTTLALPDFALDEHLDGPGPSGSALAASSVINQAIGVLLWQGRTPEHAERTIADRAGAAGVSRAAAAAAILDELDQGPG